MTISSCRVKSGLDCRKKLFDRESSFKPSIGRESGGRGKDWMEGSEIVKWVKKFGSEPGTEEGF